MKRKLSEVLWEAANKHLCPTEWERAGESEYSCLAVEAALANENVRADKIVYDFLRSLGCDVSRVQTFGTRHGEKRQGCRYMWLLIAMHCAEDEGIEL